jgi:hypothetical protein
VLLMTSPAPATALYVRTILFARDERLFLSVMPMRRKKWLVIAVSARTPRSSSNRSQSACRVMSDFSALSASRNSRCGSSLGRRYPPILLAAREPLLSKHSTHLMAEDSLTPKRAAAARRLISARATASITQVAQVLRICTGHPCWPPSSQQVESEQYRFGNPNRFKLGTASSSPDPPAKLDSS